METYLAERLSEDKKGTAVPKEKVEKLLVAEDEATDVLLVSSDDQMTTMIAELEKERTRQRARCWQARE